MKFKKLSLLIILSTLTFHVSSNTQNESSMEKIDSSEIMTITQNVANVLKVLNDAQIYDQMMMLELELSYINDNIDSLLSNEYISFDDKEEIKDLIASKARVKDNYTSGMAKYKGTMKRFFVGLGDPKSDYQTILNKINKLATQSGNSINQKIQNLKQRLPKNQKGSQGKKWAQKSKKAFKAFNQQLLARSKSLEKIKKLFTNTNFSKLTKVGEKLKKIVKFLGPIADTYEIVMIGDKLINNTLTASDASSGLVAAGALGTLVIKNPLFKKALAPVALAEGIRQNSANAVGLLDLAISDGTWEEKFDMKEEQASIFKFWDNSGKMTPSQMKHFYTAQIDKGIHHYKMTMIKLLKSVQKGDEEKIKSYISILKGNIDTLRLIKEDAGTYASKWGLAAAMETAIEPHKINALNDIVESEDGLYLLQLSSLSNAKDSIIYKQVKDSIVTNNENLTRQIPKIQSVFQKNSVDSTALLENEKKSGDVLLLLNADLSNQLKALYEESKDPNASKSKLEELLKKIFILEQQLDSNARQYVVLRNKIQAMEPDAAVKYGELVNDHTHLRKQVASDPSEIESRINNLNDQVAANIREKIKRNNAKNKQKDSNLVSKAKEQLALNDLFNSTISDLQILEAEIESKKARLEELTSNLDNSQNTASPQQIGLARNRAERLRQIWNIYRSHQSDVTQAVDPSKLSTSQIYKIMLIAKSFDQGWKELFSQSYDLYKLSMVDLKMLASSPTNIDYSAIAEIRQLDQDLINLRNKFYNLTQTHNNVASKLNDGESLLAGLVQDKLSSDKQTIATNAPNNSAEAIKFYSGRISVRGSKLLIASRITAEDKSGDHVPLLGGELFPVNIDAGIFTGKYNITSVQTEDFVNNQFVPYTHTSWGYWGAGAPGDDPIFIRSSGSVHGLSTGHWIIGEYSKNIPKQGSATFEGSIVGDHQSKEDVHTANAITGTVTINADFANSTVSGNLNILYNNAAWANPTLNNGVFRGDGVRYKANLDGGIYGDLRGTFFGEDGKTPIETGGTWFFQKNDKSSANGILRAKKQ